MISNDYASFTVTPPKYGNGLLKYRENTFSDWISEIYSKDHLEEPMHVGQLFGFFFLCTSLLTPPVEWVLRGY